MLRQAGLVESASEGRAHRYHLTPGPMVDAASWIAEIGGRWDRRLERLRRQFDT